jgi:hypothetical protein
MPASSLKPCTMATPSGTTPSMNARGTVTPVVKLMTLGTAIPGIGPRDHLTFSVDQMKNNVNLVNKAKDEWS